MIHIREEYQRAHIDKIIDAVSSKRKVCAQLPTGGGKTVEFAFITQRFIRGYILDSSSSVLILVHRQELMKQAAKTIKNVLGIEPSLITSKTTKFKVARIYIGMVESTLPRLNMLHNVGMVIIDECHIANFNKVHSVFLEELIIGFSATPISSSKKEPLNKYYHSIVTGPQISELIKMKYLAQNVTRCPKEVVDTTKFEIDKMKGDYKEAAMSAEYRLPKFVMSVVQSYWKFCNKEKVLVFNVSIEHSKEVTSCFVHCGINARHLDSNCTDEERAEIFYWFKTTEDAVLCSVMIPTVGFDEPTVKNVILNYATLSLTKFIQCCGRGGRIIDKQFINNFQNEYPYKLEEKSFFNIIDLGANYSRFGDWNDERDWEEIFNNPERVGNGIAPVKTCPDCDGLLHAATMVCTLKNEAGDICGHEFQRRKTAKEQDLEEMILVTKGIDIQMLIDKNTRKYQYYTFLEMAIPIVESMYNDYPEPNITVLDKYFKIYYCLCISWYNKTIAPIRGNIQDITNSSWHLKKAKNNFDTLVNVKKPKNKPRLNESQTNYSTQSKSYSV